MRTFTVSALLGMYHSATALELSTERLYDENYMQFTREDIWERFTREWASKPGSLKAGERFMTRNEVEALMEYFDYEFWVMDGKAMGK